LLSKFNKKITDLTNHYQVVSGYGQTAADLASGACDIGVGYADFRRDYEAKWTKSAADGGFGRTESVWKETGVLFVTDGVMNDTISVAPKSAVITDKFIKAIQESFIEIAKTPAGLKAIAIYSHEGYKVVTDADYAATRKAAEVLSGK
jgi:phosphonate transport system substrate-binding protein